MEIKIQIHIIFKLLVSSSRAIKKKAITIMSCNSETICILVKSKTFLQNFPGKTPISDDSLLLSMADFQKMGRFPTI